MTSGYVTTTMCCQRTASNQRVHTQLATTTETGSAAASTAITVATTTTTTTTTATTSATTCTTTATTTATTTRITFPEDNPAIGVLAELETVGAATGKHTLRVRGGVVGFPTQGQLLRVHCVERCCRACGGATVGRRAWYDTHHSVGGIVVLCRRRQGTFANGIRSRRGSGHVMHRGATTDVEFAGIAISLITDSCRGTAASPSTGARTASFNTRGGVVASAVGSFIGGVKQGNVFALQRAPLNSSMVNIRLGEPAFHRGRIAGLSAVRQHAEPPLVMAGVQDNKAVACPEAELAFLWLASEVVQRTRNAIPAHAAR